MNYLLYFFLIINDNCIFFSDKTAKSTLNELLVNVIETELANLYKSTESVEQLKESIEKIREIVSIEQDEFANQFAGR